MRDRGEEQMKDKKACEKRLYDGISAHVNTNKWNERSHRHTYQDELE